MVRRTYFGYRRWNPIFLPGTSSENFDSTECSSEFRTELYINFLSSHYKPLCIEIFLLLLHSFLGFFPTNSNVTATFAFTSDRLSTPGQCMPKNDTYAVSKNAGLNARKPSFSRNYLRSEYTRTSRSRHPLRPLKT